ncbi:MAG: selenide, water dikinase SelD [Acidimicrobiia bacterium]|nr:MAG: selenide, water dikinase SelD [Acidimicrobiia bacterium]
MGITGLDDAGVFRLGTDRTIVQTVDFFTPIVDDPYDWGRITAANALSDVYAMGADPLTALQLVGWPRDTIPFDVLGHVIEGGLEIMSDAGCTVVGGHSVDDAEPKYGFAVTGVAPPRDITTNSAAEPGQTLILTKPLGTGIIATAAKHGKAPDETVQKAIATMVTLNRNAANAVRRIGARAVTDVTGFGLLGHLSEMTRGSGVSAEIDSASVPTLDGVRLLAAAGEIPGGTRRNLAAVASHVISMGIAEDMMWVLADAQTSGGLLIAVDTPLSEALIQALDDEGVGGSPIGRIVERTFEHGPSGRILIS